VASLGRIVDVADRDLAVASVGDLAPHATVRSDVDADVDRPARSVDDRVRDELADDELYVKQPPVSDQALESLQGAASR
jgi:hypothetical protein